MYAFCECSTFTSIKLKKGCVLSYLLHYALLLLILLKNYLVIEYFQFCHNNLLINLIILDSRLVCILWVFNLNIIIIKVKKVIMILLLILLKNYLVIELPILLYRLYLTKLEIFLLVMMIIYFVLKKIYMLLVRLAWWS